MNTMASNMSEGQPQQQQQGQPQGQGQGQQQGGQGQGQVQYAQQFVAQQGGGPQQVQYVQPGQQQFVLSTPQQGAQGQGGYVVMMQSGNQEQQSGGTQGALAQAFGGLGVQPEQKRVQRGVVKRWNLEKGYGFIQPVEGGDDVFVHHTVIHAQGFKSLMEGSEVEYESVQIAPGRIRAQKVTGPNGSYARGAPRPPNPPMITATTAGPMQVVQLITLPNGQTAAAPVQQGGSGGGGGAQQVYYTSQDMGGQGGGVPVQAVQTVQGGQQFHAVQVQGGNPQQIGSVGGDQSRPSEGGWGHVDQQLE